MDSTWRSGTADVGWTGKGDDREQWITFRDGACYNVIVKPGPLYPLNSIMHHGMVLGTKFQAARVSKGEDGKQDNRDLKNDARIYFGSGANLQELYLTPSMMDKKAWDDVCLLYTSDAAEDQLGVDLGGRGLVQQNINK